MYSVSVPWMVIISYPNEEVNSTEPSPSVSVPWTVIIRYPKEEVNRTQSSPSVSVPWMAIPSQISHVSFSCRVHLVSMLENVFYSSLTLQTGKQLVFLIAINYRGRYWKGTAIYNKNFCFNEQKCIFEHCRKVKTSNLTLHFFVITPVYLFRAATYKLTFALHRDALL